MRSGLANRWRRFGPIKRRFIAHSLDSGSPSLLQQPPQLVAIDKPRQSTDCEQAKGHRIELPVLRLVGPGRLALKPESDSYHQTVKQTPLTQPQPERLGAPASAGDQKQPSLAQPRQVGRRDGQHQPKPQEDLGQAVNSTARQHTTPSNRPDTDPERSAASRWR